MLHSSDTNAVWGIQVYTDNLAADANPKYLGSDDPKGLVGVTNSSTTLPLCWRVLEYTTAYADLTITESPPGTLSWPWKWLKDKGTPGFSNGDWYQTVWSDEGMLWGDNESQRSGGMSPLYIYLGGKFSQATIQTYATNKFTLEQFHP